MLPQLIRDGYSITGFRIEPPGFPQRLESKKGGCKKVPSSQIKDGLVCYAKGMDFSLQTLGSQWRCLTEEVDKTIFQGMGLRGAEGLLE